jgi:protein ImuB
MSRFFCLNIADFPAWAAARSDTALRDKPLVIYAGGKVIAASSQAREAGIESGWSLARSQAHLPGLIALPQHAPTTQAAWQEVLAALYDLTPQIESLRPGMAMADIRPETIVVPLLREWHAHGGSAQGGVADDRTTAELAALIASPGALRRIKPGRSQTFLRYVPVDVLHHVGIHPRTIERIGWFGWKHLAQLRPLSRQQLVAQFFEGERLYRYAQASDVRPVASYQPPSVIRAHFTFEQSVREPGEIEPVLKYLLEEAHGQLERRVPGSLAVGLETPQGRLQGRRLLREEAVTLHALHTAAALALEAVLPQAKAVSGVELQLDALTELRPAQGDLFEPSRPPVEAAVGAMEHRYPGMLRRIVLLDKNAYLPEEAFRLEPVALPREKVAASRPISTRGRPRQRWRGR